MRELIGSETKMVAAAGVVTDDPKMKEALNQFDEFCKVITTISSSASSGASKAFDEVSPPTPGVDMANKVVHKAVDVMDSAFTSVFQSIKNLFG